MKICIDAGHGGKDSGAVGAGGRREKDDNLRMALALRDAMARRGHNVVMTRDKDEYPEISARYNLANAVSADVYVSLHRNCADSASANGLEVLYRTISDKTAADNARSKKLAEDMDGRLVRATGFRDRGAKAQNTNTAVLQKTRMPAVTVEAGFVSNASDNARFDEVFAAIIDAIADSLEALFGKGKQTAAATATQTKIPASVPAHFLNGGTVRLTSPYTRGSAVVWVQERLAKHNALPGGSIDGIFGRNTETGVKLFQTARSREGRDIGAVDGIVGRKTAAILAE